ncbi:BNR-4 repeat-containing protein [Flammeovirga sp. OC4]|uniref:BNR-4 repeat-containing protein n=1 Tax=Flammeovirga sp. OC4 TaxID=1382345 RepID=UPI0005C6574D|nr:BNR-4 repeat-containing protein [Flammeovirga sp. OC4]
MKYLFSIALLMLSVGLISNQTAEEKVNYFSNNAFGNPVTGKAGEYYNGVTYVAYQGEKEDPYVVAYDHKKDKWRGPYKAGTSLLGKTPGRKIDNHGKPTLVVDGEGYIHIVFGGHGGTRDLGENKLGNYHDGKQIHVKSKRPMDISEWEEVENITPFGTYSQFMKLDNGDIYLFFRHGAHRSNWVYQVSKDNCRTFSPKVSFLKTKPSNEVNDWDSWYVNLQKGEGNDILLSYNYHFCKSVKKGHDGERHHCYYMKFDTDTKQFFNVKGEALTLPITKEYADQKTLAINTGDQWNHIGRSDLNDEGYPHISWYEGAHGGKRHGGPKQLMHYQWTGDEWVGGETNVPNKARGELVAKSKNEVSYLLEDNENKLGNVAWWESHDGGAEFKKSKVLLEEKGGKLLMSHFIRNAHPDAKVIVTQNIKGTAYSKVYLLGENGPIKRKQSEADVLQLN